MSDQKQLFEVLGYFEQLYDPAKNRVVGLRTCELGDRVVGYAGEKRITVVGKIEVQNGTRIDVVNFKKKTELLSTVYPLCGRRL